MTTRTARVRHHHPRLTLRPQAKAGERGFTLIEIIVAIAILGVIIVPLSTALVTSFRVTGSVSQNLNNSIARDTLASVFTNDVATVDAAGVSNVEEMACKPASAPSGWFLVTFNSSKLTSTGTTANRRVSYFQTGTGKDATVIRNECPNAPATTGATSGTTRVLADGLGSSGQTGQQVFGWFPPVADFRPACDEFKCGLDMPFATPRYIGVNAQRRVFGAGVPQEAGRIISSSKSANSAAGVAYQQYDVNNTPTTMEIELAENELTLPPGLDPDSAMTVTYAVKQVETGRWLTGALGSLDFDSLAAGADPSPADRPYVNGYYKDGQWRMPFAFKPTTYNVTPTSTVTQPALSFYGGEYQVYTRLQENGRGAKDYGGVDGFSLWVDWRQEDSVFVNSLAANCATNDGLSRSTAVCTPAAGLQIANTAGLPNVLVNVANGNPYDGTVNIDGAAYGDGRTIVGGLDARWIRGAPGRLDPALGELADGRSAIIGTSGAHATGIYINGKTNIRLRQLNVDSGAPTGTGASAYGVRGNESSVIIENSVIGARDATAGAHGAAGTAGGNGNAAQNGGEANFFPGDWLSWLGNLLLGGSFWDGWFQSGAKGLPNPAQNGTVRAGGIGGKGGEWWSDGTAGSPGGAGASGGQGGNGSVFGTGNRPGGGGGGNGNCASSPATARNVAGCGGGGSAGSKGTAAPTATNVAQWTGTSGGNGGNGYDGGGGGGGGGGMAASAWGGGGGGGGTGGARGTGGGGGQAGGGSFGIFTHNTALTVTDSRVAAGYSGSGGNGGRGGDGGDGGRGGNGGNKTCCESTGGSGGGGGGGGGSGGGGGGGGAGPSVAIYGFLSGGNTTLRPTVTGTTLAHGGAGFGGSYGEGGTRGTEGAGGGRGDCQLAGGRCPHGGHAGIVGVPGAAGTAADPVGRNNKVWWNEVDVSGFYP